MCGGGVGADPLDPDREEAEGTEEHGVGAASCEGEKGRGGVREGRRRRRLVAGNGVGERGGGRGPLPRSRRGRGERRAGGSEWGGRVGGG